MMREIKFRGKRKDTGEWVYGYYYNAYNETHYIIYMNGKYQNSVEVIPETIGQYIGLNDKNGKEIYEGDVVSYVTKFYGKTKQHKKIVEWKEDIYCDNFGEPNCVGYFNIDKSMEIIGNIYDNPELLKR